MAMIYLGPLGSGELVAKGARLTGAEAQWIVEAQALIDAARKEAQAIVQAAHERAKNIFRDAHQAGLSEGIAQGQQQMSALLSEAHARANRHVRDLEPVFADAVVHAVSKLVGEAGPTRFIERAVLHVRDRLGETDGMVLRVQPQLAHIALEAVVALTSKYGMALPLRVEQDSTLKDFHCVVESSLGRAEVRLDEQLNRLRQVFGEAFAGTEHRA